MLVMYVCPICGPELTLDSMAGMKVKVRWGKGPVFSQKNFTLSCPSQNQL